MPICKSQIPVLILVLSNLVLIVGLRQHHLQDLLLGLASMDNGFHSHLHAALIAHTLTNSKVLPSIVPAPQ